MVGLVLFAVVLTSCSRVRDPFHATLVSLILLSSISGIYFTSGVTSMCVSVIVLLFYPKEVIVGRGVEVRTYIFFLPVAFYVFFFGLNLIRLVDLSSATLSLSSYDSPFYARLVDYVRVTGNENYDMDFVYHNDGAIRLYHYTEIWLCALIKGIFNAEPTTHLLEFVTYPVLQALATFSFFGLQIKAGIKRIAAFFFSLVFSVGVAVPELSFFVRDILPSMSFRAWSILSAPKLSVVYIILPQLMSSVRREDLRLTGWLLSMLAITYVTYYPVCGLVLAAGFLRSVVKGLGDFRAIASCVIPYLVSSILLVVFVQLGSTTQSVSNEIIDISVWAKFISEHGISIFGSGIITLFVLFSPVVILIVWLGNDVRINLLEISLIATMCLGGLIGYIAMGYELEAFQLFENVAIPVLNVSLLFVLVLAIANKPHWIQGILLATIALVSLRGNQGEFNTASFSEMERIARFFKGDREVRTAFIRSQGELVTVRGKSPNLNPPAEVVQHVLSSYSPLSINELGWENSSSLYRKREEEFRQSSSFWKFVQRQDAQGKTVGDLQSEFIKLQNLKYLEVCKGCSIKNIDLVVEDSLVLKSGVRIYVVTKVLEKKAGHK